MIFKAGVIYTIIIIYLIVITQFDFREEALTSSKNSWIIQQIKCKLNESDKKIFQRTVNKELFVLILYFLIKNW